MRSTANARTVACPMVAPASCLFAVPLVMLGGLAATWSGMGYGRLVMLLVVSPILEEAVARAGLQEVLIRLRAGSWTANLVAAVAFGFAHGVARGEILAGLGVIAPALLLGYAYGRWRSVRACAALHAGMNALWLLVASSIQASTSVL